MGMTIDPRTRGLTAAVDGVCAVGWFVWARSGESASVDLISEVGAAAGFVIALVGLMFAAARYDAPAAAAAAPRRRTIRIGVAVAVPVIAGWGVLAAVGADQWAPVWVCAGMGLFILASAGVVETPFLTAIGVAVTASALLAVIVAAETTLAPATVAGVGAGTCLLVAAAGSLAAASAGSRRTGRRARREPV
jgi:hypothetical protein